jgi:hypothetical protein
MRGTDRQQSSMSAPAAALVLVEQIPGWRRITLGADKGSARKEFVEQLSDHQVTAHLARKSPILLMSEPLVIRAI